MAYSNNNIYVPSRNQSRSLVKDDATAIIPKGAIFIAALGFAQFCLFVALLGPVMVSMVLKAETLSGDSLAITNIVGNVLGVGAIAALIGNVLFGYLSDRTRSRYGRRRPWIVGGVLFMALSLYMISLADSVAVLLIAWFCAQLGANAAFGPFIATLSDQLPRTQYGKASAVIGIAQNVGVLAATWLASKLSGDMFLLFMVPAFIGVAGMLGYALILKDPPSEEPATEFQLKNLLKAFWVNPVKHSDFGYAWLSRFLVIFSTFLFTTYRLPYVIEHFSSESNAVDIVFNGVLAYTICLVICGYLAGKISDRLGKRKAFVFASLVIFSIGTYSLIHLDSITQFYIAEALLGAAFGIYTSVDMALVLEVLPNPDQCGKDLGVFNIAGVLPQSLAPLTGAILLNMTSGDPNYHLLLIVAGVSGLLGAITILPIKKVK
ncbi:MFS transporter [Halomonas sp. SF2003]|nr:MFS transporter [Halomonas sp. SF2003]